MATTGTRWKFRRAVECRTPTGRTDAHGTYVEVAASGVQSETRCGFCGLTLDKRVEPLVVDCVGVTWFTARQVARATFHTDELTSEPTTEDADLVLSWSGHDSGSRPTRALVIDDGEE